MLRRTDREQEMAPGVTRRSRTEPSFPITGGFGDPASASGQAFPDLLIFFFPPEMPQIYIYILNLPALKRWHLMKTS